MPGRRLTRAVRPAVIVIALALGLATSVVIAGWIALRIEPAFSWTKGVEVNTRPDGEPSFTSWVNYRDEYRPGFTRVEAETRQSRVLLNRLMAGRVRQELNDPS